MLRTCRSSWAVFLAISLVLVSVSGCFAVPIPDLSRLRDRLFEETASAPRVVTRIVTAIPSASATRAPASEGRADESQAVEGEISLERLYELVNESVVNILVANRVEGGGLRPPGGSQEPDEFYQRGQGSGFVYDRDGHIITNNHVVANADEVTVTFNDDLAVPAVVVGTDPDTDLAVLRVDLAADHLRPLPLGDSDALRVGQQVVAIGNPFGLAGSMTTGIVSALGRLLPSTGTAQYSIPDIIQTDAAINPGNSGGPLLDTAGNVVGVNAAIESPVRGFSGVGFAIPVDIVKKVVPVLIDEGAYEHAWLGIRGVALSPELARAMDLEDNQRGVQVVDAVRDGPAARAGLRGSIGSVRVQGTELPVGGDIIVAADDVPVRKFEDLISYLVRQTEVGQRVSLRILREGKITDVDVTLAARPAQ